jgi:hypothetical protein
MNSLITLNKN